jgi:hypothetical protein
MRNRKLSFAAWFLATFLGACFAQDVIVTKDGKKINAKVTEVNIDDVKYKNFDNQDGPTYTLLKSAVSSIRYQNGTEETFEAITSPGLTPTPTPATSTTSATRTQPAQQRTGVQGDDRLYVKGNSLYLGTRKLRSRGAQRTFADSPDLFFQYKQAKTQTRWSVPVILIGSVGAYIGVYGLIFGKREYNMRDDYYYYDFLAPAYCAVITVVGAGIIVGGIYLGHSGRAKLRNIASEYNATHALSEYSASRQPYLGLALTGNGVGLQLTF